MRRTFIVCLGVLRFIKEKFLSGRKLITHGLRCFIGKGAYFLFRNNGQCEIGDKTWLGNYSYFEANGGKITIGENNFFNSGCHVVSLQSIEIGNNNLFAPYVLIVDHDHCYSDQTKLICKQGYNKAPVKIGSNIWVGAHVTICAGVEICDHVVIGANSVVTKNILVPGVYVGAPVKRIKMI